MIYFDDELDIENTEITKDYSKYKDVRNIYFIDPYEILTLMKATLVEIKNITSNHIDMYTDMNNVMKYLDECEYLTDRYRKLKNALEETKRDLLKAREEQSDEEEQDESEEDIDESDVDCELYVLSADSPEDDITIYKVNEDGSKTFDDVIPRKVL